MVRHFGKIQCPLASYGLTRLRECSTVDWQGSEMLSGFKINCSPSQLRYPNEFPIHLVNLFVLPCYVKLVFCYIYIAYSITCRVEYQNQIMQYLCNSQRYTIKLFTSVNLYFVRLTAKSIVYICMICHTILYSHLYDLRLVGKLT